MFINILHVQGAASVASVARVARATSAAKFSGDPRSIAQPGDTAPTSSIQSKRNTWECGRRTGVYHNLWVELMFMVVSSVYNPLELSVTIVYYAYISPLLSGTAPPCPSAVPNVWVVND